MLEKLHQEAIHKREDLLEKLAKLWDRLKIDSTYREEFLFKYPSISRSNMEAVRITFIFNLDYINVIIWSEV